MGFDVSEDDDDVDGVEDDEDDEDDGVLVFVPFTENKSTMERWRMRGWDCGVFDKMNFGDGNDSAVRLVPKILR